ncbi:MAG: Spo0B domain-containing protein [Syntrophomonas sp.]
MQAQKAVELFSRIKHDFANHLQVISGYIDLGRYQEIKAYIAAIVEEFMMERTAFQSLDAEAVLYFYENILLAHDLGIILKYNDLKISSIARLQEKDEPAGTLRCLSVEFKGQDFEPVICLSVYEEDRGIDLYFSCEYWEHNPVIVEIRE